MRESVSIEELRRAFTAPAGGRVILAADTEDAFLMLEMIEPKECHVKIGKHMFTKFGPSIVKKVQQRGFKVFLDLKYHDIPNTVADAVEAAADLGVWMVNMHALGGRKMMEAAANRLEQRNFQERPILIGVTVLTSLLEDALTEMSIAHTPNSLSWSLANLAYKSGLDGVVCSPKELTSLKYCANMDNNFKYIVPGVRPAGSDKDDQERIATPTEAVRDGATYLVIGRPILNASNPVDALKSINQSLVDYDILTQQGMGI